MLKGLFRFLEAENNQHIRPTTLKDEAFLLLYKTKTKGLLILSIYRIQYVVQFINAFLLTIIDNLNVQNSSQCKPQKEFVLRVTLLTIIEFKNHFPNDLILR